jgi:hypothetical protein
VTFKTNCIFYKDLIIYILFFIFKEKGPISLFSGSILTQQGSFLSAQT